MGSPQENRTIRQEPIDFLNQGTRERHDARATIYHKGQPAIPRELFYVEKGRVELLRQSRHARERIVRVIGPGTFFGIDDWEQENRTESARAGIDGAMVTRVLLTEEKLATDSTLRHTVLSVMAERVRALSKEKTVNNLGDISNKIAYHLLYNLSVDGIAHLSTPELADTLGSQRSQVGIRLREFQARGLIMLQVNPGFPFQISIEIKDAEELAKIAEHASKDPRRRSL